MSTSWQKIVFFYKHGLENSVVHQDVITLQLKPTLKRLSIKSNMIFALNVYFNLTYKVVSNFFFFFLVTIST